MSVQNFLGELTVVVRPYDMLYPLYRQAVDAPGLRLHLDHESPIDTAYGENPPPAAEFSLGRYTMLRAQGDDRWVGVPFFVLRGFRHGTYLVSTGSETGDLAESRGHRIGITGWFDTGNVWARAALRDSGVGLDDVEWWTVPADPDHPLRPAVHASDPKLPENVRVLDADQPLVGQLLTRRLDAVTVASPQRELSASPASLRRMLADHRSVEMNYLTRTGVYPIFHLIVVHRSACARNPGILDALYEGLVASWSCWWKQLRATAELAPWTGAELDTRENLLGESVAPYGLSGVNSSTIEAFCHEEVEQGIVGTAPTMSELFPHFVDQR